MTRPVVSMLATAAVMWQTVRLLEQRVPRIPEITVGDLYVFNGKRYVVAEATLQWDAREVHGLRLNLIQMIERKKTDGQEARQTPPQW